RETVSYVLQQKKIRLVITGSLKEETRISSFVKKHGDGVKDIALAVDNVEDAYSAAVERGAIAIQPPFEIKDEHGVVKKAVIGTYG
ncbi:4-hydroxyphenylpyruvate dioxygenase, partial [Pseudomonas sp. MPR-R5A]